MDLMMIGQLMILLLMTSQLKILKRRKIQWRNEL
jgi:hypothetical protein